MSDAVPVREAAAERALRVATTLAAAETTALILLVLVRDAGRTPLLTAALACKYPLCALARRRHAGGFVGLLLWEVVGALVALTAPRVPAAVRTFELAVTVVVLVLLARASRLFPSPRLPER